MQSASSISQVFEWVGPDSFALKHCRRQLDGAGIIPIILIYNVYYVCVWVYYTMLITYYINSYTYYEVHEVVVAQYTVL